MHAAAHEAEQRGQPPSSEPGGQGRPASRPPRTPFRELTKPISPQRRLAFPVQPRAGAAVPENPGSGIFEERKVLHMQRPGQRPGTCGPSSRRRWPPSRWQPGWQDSLPAPPRAATVPKTPPATTLGIWTSAEDGGSYSTVAGQHPDIANYYLAWGQQWPSQFISQAEAAGATPVHRDRTLARRPGLEPDPVLPEHHRQRRQRRHRLHPRREQLRHLLRDLARRHRPGRRAARQAGDLHLRATSSTSRASTPGPPATPAAAGPRPARPRSGSPPGTRSRPRSTATGPASTPPGCGRRTPTPAARR